ncbi:MAG: site-2 protease family protein [Eubacterium sp.]
MSIFSYLRTGDYLEAILIILSRSFIVFCCLPIHELAHGFVAYKCGDNTAKYKGRLTFNPFAHLNPIGTIMIFLFGIGYANPVPVNPARLKHPRRDMALISLAGPASNLIMAFISGFIFTALNSFVSEYGTVLWAVAYFFYYAAMVNVTLAVFNLIPIPPLDGSKILASVLPDKIYFKYMQYERYVMIALMLLLFTGFLDRPISFLANAVMYIILFIPNLIF